jgi:hypothetical protein
MRYFKVQRDEETDDLHVVTEMPSWNDGNGDYAWPQGWRGGEDDEYPRDEVEAMPGGPAALERWYAGDDAAFQAWRRREHDNWVPDDDVA